VALDLWDPHLATLREHLPRAEGKIVIDKFHIAKHRREAVDRVRRREHTALTAEEDERLKGTKYDWLQNPALRDREQQQELETARAWAPSKTASNAASESLNTKIEWLKYTVRGIRNKQNFIPVIYFQCGGLNLALSSTKSPERPKY
jgi:transposase